MSKLSDHQIADMTRRLHEFGYPAVPRKTVREKAEKILAREIKPDVIDLFIEGWLRDAKFLPHEGD